MQNRKLSTTALIANKTGGDLKQAERAEKQAIGDRKSKNFEEKNTKAKEKADLASYIKFAQADEEQEAREAATYRPSF